jgi:hypothetical protein
VSPFKLLEKGARPTFLDHDFANSILRFLNGIVRAKVTPTAAGKFVVAGDTFLLDLSASSSAVQAQQIADLQKTIAALQGQVDAINGALKTASIAAVCNPSDSTITVTLVLKNLP